MKTAHILIIEDNQFNHELIDYLLKEAGYATSSTWDGKDGLDTMRNTSIDLILCDLQMPVMNGYEVIRAVKSDTELKSIPIVAVTASSMSGDSEKVIASGFDGYISKPIEPRTFVQQIEAFLPQALRRSAGKI